MIEKTKNRKTGIILAGYIVLKPLYLRPSGSLQISDIFLIICLVWLVIQDHGRIIIKKNKSRIIGLFFALCVYQLFVNTIWSIILGRTIIKPTLYYFFNLIVVYITFSVSERVDYVELLRLILNACSLSLLITFIGLFLRLGGVRSLGFFNNPNQLGYYALIMLTFLLYYFQHKNLMTKIVVGGMSIWAIIASASKAAFIGAALTIFLYTIFGKSQGRRKLNQLVLQMAILVILTILLYVLFFSDNQTVLSNRTLFFLRRRILGMANESDSALGVGRGYDRVFEVGRNILWGMGEGAYSRFTSLRGLESHSSYVTLYVSYGLIGFLGYVVLFREMVFRRKYRVQNTALLSGILIYNASHNGLRNSLMWMLLALMYLDGLNTDAHRTPA